MLEVRIVFFRLSLFDAQLSQLSSTNPFSRLVKLISSSNLLCAVVIGANSAIEAVRVLFVIHEANCYAETLTRIMRPTPYVLFAVNKITIVSSLRAAIRLLQKALIFVYAFYTLSFNLCLSTMRLNIKDCYFHAPYYIFCLVLRQLRAFAGFSLANFNGVALFPICWYAKLKPKILAYYHGHTLNFRMAF